MRQPKNRKGTLVTGKTMIAISQVMTKAFTNITEITGGGYQIAIPQPVVAWLATVLAWAPNSPETDELIQSLRNAVTAMKEANRANQNQTRS